MGVSRNTGLGYGQTWKNVTASRTAGVSYYNTTTKPIQVSIIGAVSGTSSGVAGYVEDAEIVRTNAQQATGLFSSHVTMIIPIGGKYKAIGTISSWNELREP